MKILELVCDNYFTILKKPLISNLSHASNAFLNIFNVISKTLSIFLPSGYIEVPQSTLMESLRFYLNLSPYTGIVYLAHFNLAGFNFSHMCCKNMDFSYANLEGANLSFGDFTAASFYGVNLKKSNMYAATLRHAILIDADLRDAFIRSALLNKSDITFFRGLRIGVNHIYNFVPEIYSHYDLFRIYSDSVELSRAEKEKAIRNVWEKLRFAHGAYDL